MVKKASNGEPKVLVHKIYKPYQMRHKVTFCNLTNKTSGAGINQPILTPAFSLHFAYVKKTLTMKYDALGTNYENSQIIAVQHNDAVNNKLKCIINGQTFDILDVSSDSELYVSYDLITISFNKGLTEHGR